MNRIQLRRMEDLVEEAWQHLPVDDFSDGCDCDVVNSVVDLLVQANIDLNTVALDEMKGLLGHALESRRQMCALLP